VNPGDDDKGATLQAVANYFTTLKINNAINLDGSGASQLYFPENNQKSSPSDYWWVERPGITVLCQFFWVFSDVFAFRLPITITSRRRRSIFRFKRSA